MQKQPFFLTIFIALALSALSFTACRKSIDTPDGSALSALDVKANAQMQNTVTVLQDIIYEAVATSPALNTVSGSLTVGQCPQVIVTPKFTTDSFPAVLSIDFGTGCTWRGHDISGKIVLEVSGKVSAGNATLKGEITQLTIDGNSITGTLNISTGAGNNALRNMTFIVTDGKVTTDENKVILIDAIIATRTQVEGQNTTVGTTGMAAFQDDVFEIVFTGTGTGADGKDFELTTPTPLRRSMTCRWIAIGRVEVQSGLKNASIDFGAGDCDNQVVIAIEGVEKTLTLR